MKPWLTDYEIALFEGILRKLAKRKTKLDILEWGSGGSTIHFPKFLLKRKVKFNWTALEHDLEWFDKVQRKLVHATELVLIPLVGDDPFKEDMDEYVNFPKAYNKKYDLIFIDGRKRARCLAMAAKYIKPDGYVVLDDAFRQKYHESFKYYKWKFLEASNKLWLGQTKGKKQ